MSGFLLDTNVPSELTRIHPDRRVAKWLENTDDNDLFFSVISIGEICKGFTVHPEEHRRASLRRWLNNTFRPWFAGRILPIGEAVSERWGILEGESQLRGLTLNVPDGMIAATGSTIFTIVTRNVKDFERLRVAIFNRGKPVKSWRFVAGGHEITNGSDAVTNRREFILNQHRCLDASKIQ